VPVGWRVAGRRLWCSLRCSRPTAALSDRHSPYARCSLKPADGAEAQAFFTEWEESFDSFDQMGLHENLLRGIYAYGGHQLAVHGRHSIDALHERLGLPA
jgi:hypothetical protein